MSSIFRDSKRLKVISVFGFGRPKSHYFVPQITENGCFRIKKRDFWCQNPKKETTFCRLLSPKMMDRAPDSCKNLFVRAFRFSKQNLLCYSCVETFVKSTNGWGEISHQLTRFNLIVNPPKLILLEFCLAKKGFVFKIK